MKASKVDITKHHLSDPFMADKMAESHGEGRERGGIVLGRLGMAGECVWGKDDNLATNTRTNTSDANYVKQENASSYWRWEGKAALIDSFNISIYLPSPRLRPYSVAAVLSPPQRSNIKRCDRFRLRYLGHQTRGVVLLNYHH
ncbi:hypothetical protein AAF712_016531 [Marasmius tenuissimus]|uniref:Uncharacterized protein n=1 Tax=Marasmius tenuissimus TaxID=585030 RepID=A0ABR2Z6H6_9AGAR